MRTCSRRKRQLQLESVSGLGKSQKMALGSVMLLLLVLLVVGISIDFYWLYNLFVSLDQDIVPYVVSILILFALGIGVVLVSWLFTLSLGRKKK